MDKLPNVSIKVKTTMCGIVSESQGTVNWRNNRNHAFLDESFGAKEVHG